MALLPADVSAQARPEGQGRVVTVDESRPSLTLDHGPIPGVMPAMRMLFAVADKELLRELREGDAVRFRLESLGPEWVIVAVKKTSPASRPGPLAFPAPDFTLPTLEDGSLRLADLRGKVVLVNFWATWCIPCRTEMPALEALYQRYQARGLEIVAVNLDTISTAGVEAFTKEVRVTFPIALDPTWSAAKAYRVHGLPTSYLIDRAGQVVVREVGERDWSDDLTRTALEQLLQSEGGRRR
jgi:thiol-disulfide isomerase/thioredoxin